MFWIIVAGCLAGLLFVGWLADRHRSGRGVDLDVDPARRDAGRANSVYHAHRHTSEGMGHPPGGGGSL